MPLVLVHSARRNCWLRFEEPLDIIAAYTPGAVIPALKRIEKITGRDGLHVAGFLAYEAAAGLDGSLKTKDMSGFPLLWFGVFGEPEVVDHPEGDSDMGSADIDWRPSIGPEEYRRSIGLIKDYIAAGDTYQVNFTYRLRARVAMPAWDLFVRMADAQAGRYSAYIDTGEWAICSASPELFFELDGARIVSRPMKGTAARGLSAEDDLRMRDWLKRSGKDRAENVMITDMVRNDIGRIAFAGSEETALCAIEKYPTLWQMTSTVAARTDASIVELFQALFPAASITGAPKCRTMEIIAGLEDSPRRIYTGSVGYIAPNRESQFNVAIRTVLIDKKTCAAEYGVGGGIVWDSVDDLELAETAVKARVLTKKQGDFRLLETMLWTPDMGYHLRARHLDRAQASAEYFSFAFGRRSIDAQLELAADGFGCAACRVRLMIDRAGAAEIEAIEIEPALSSAPPRVGLADEPVDPGDPFLYHKTTNREIYRRAAREGCDDVILWNTSGELTESTIANLILEINGRMYTPPVESGLLPGTMRAELLESGKIEERVLPIEDIYKCSRIYFINSVRGLYAVDLIAKSDLRNWGLHSQFQFSTIP